MQQVTCAVRDCCAVGSFSVSKALKEEHNVEPHQSRDGPILFCKDHFERMYGWYKIFKLHPFTEDNAAYIKRPSFLIGYELSYLEDWLKYAREDYVHRCWFQEHLKVCGPGHMHWIYRLSQLLKNLEDTIFMLKKEEEYKKLLQKYPAWAIDEEHFVMRPQDIKHRKRTGLHGWA